MIDTIIEFFKKPYLYLIIILVGILLKFYGIESRFFWIDEIYTIIHTSGFQVDEFLNQIPQDEIVNITEYHEILNLNNGKHNIANQLAGLAKMPQFTPFHYVLLVFWHNIIGAEYQDYRLFSILMFIITLPLIYLLGNRLFKSKLAGLISTSFYAVSPFFHIYAQEARYYILWFMFMVLINLLFLIAIEKN